MLKKKDKSKVHARYTRKKGPKIRPQYDLELFDLLLEYRAMDSNQIYIWLGKKTQSAQEEYRKRLRKLFDLPNAYLDRLNIGNVFVEGGGTPPVIHALSEKGRRVLKELSPNKLKYAQVSERTQKKLTPGFVKHELLKNDVVTMMYQALLDVPDWIFVRRSVFWDDMLSEELLNHPKRGVNNKYGWPVPFYVEQKDVHGTRVTIPKSKSVVPDDMNCIVNINTEKYIFFFLEADNSREAVKRKKGRLIISDIWEKLYFYNRSAELQLFKKYFDLESPFYILIVGRSEKRLENMMAASLDQEIRQGRGWKRFLFITIDELREHGFLDAPWREASENKLVYIRDLMK